MRWFMVVIVAVLGGHSIGSAETPAKLELQASGILGIKTFPVESTVEGILTKVKFRRGDHLKAGDVLVDIDSSVQEAELLKARAALKLAQARLKQLEAKPQPNALDLDVLRAEVSYAEATAQVLDLRWKRRLVLMPFDGVVVDDFVTVGMVCNRGATLVTVADPSRCWIEVEVPAPSAANIQQNQPCLVGVDGTGKVVEGKVEEIGVAKIEGFRNIVPVRVILSSMPKEWRPGMFGTVRFLDKR